jgi:Stress up-regulated Nod 19
LQPAQATGYKEVKMAWLDITGCGISSEAAEKGVYERKQKRPWTSNIDGRLLYATGHVHDGGTKTTIYRTRNGATSEICVSHAEYGGRAGYVGADGMEHISRVSYCDFAKDDSLKTGDVLFVGASYNSTAHMLMESPGSKHLEPIMGISRAYIGT